MCAFEDMRYMTETGRKETMCRYNISIDDKLMERVRPSIGEGIDEEQWLQQQLTLLLLQMTSAKAGDTDTALLTDEMKSHVLQAEEEYAEGRCLTQAEFDKRFAKHISTLTDPGNKVFLKS